MHCKNNIVFNGQLIPQMTSLSAVFAKKKVIQKNRQLPFSGLSAEDLVLILHIKRVSVGIL